MDLTEQVLLNLGYDEKDEDMKKVIRPKVEAVKLHLIKAGASAELGKDDLEVGCISIGVNDLLNQQSGEVKFSPAFNLIANQICR